MEALKKQRRAVRTAFTRAHTGFTNKMDSDASREEKTVAFQFLETKMAELDEVRTSFNKELFESTLTEEEVAKEMESDDIYKTNYLMAKLRISDLLISTSASVNTATPSTTSTRKSLNLPSIEMLKFNGNVKEWLPFWNQFKKIHGDGTITNEDKFQYLLQATISGSRANDIVKSFPPTGENYEKAVTGLKNRFGRDDLVVEFYIRELLGLVLQNAVKGRKRPSLANLYDKVESYIRALETLGVTKDKCAAMLYPLVESSLPEEVLRVWQRSGPRESADANGQRETADRLTQLLRFLQTEVENEERIDMALTGFGLSTEQDGVKKQKEETTEPMRSVASASVLLVSKEERGLKCLFCKADHDSVRCESARKLSVDERKNIVKRENACFNCLKRGHISKKCKTKEKIVRAVIDSGSQRSYVRTGIAKELGYVSRGKQQVVHSLFGGIESNTEKHDIFLIRLKNLDNSYACNFSVLNQDTICNNIPSMKHDVWVDELRTRNIVLNDLGGKDGTIDVLIGADVAGRLMTGGRCDLSNGLTAFETHLGWTVMGKLPKHVRGDTATTITTMFVREAGLCDLWSLDVIGITDPIEKLDKSVKDEKTVNFLTQTTKRNADGRYKVKLPWVEDHAPIPSNYDISRTRLTSCIKKLKKQNLHDEYNRVLNEWFAEGIIEKVPVSRVDIPAHYLPHRPVLKKYGTTKIRPVFDASACRDGYPSLNQCLEKGPNLIELVPANLNRFREGEIGVISDIRKAFLQILVSESDRDSLRFLWIEEDDIIVFRHCRVVFGLACSPFLLSAIINLHLSAALEKGDGNVNSDWSESTILKLKNAFYVDNCVTSLNSPEELSTFIRESQAIMLTGGFELRGWESSGDNTGDESTMVLGISWNKREDTLSINPTLLQVEFTEIVTERAVLSAAHKIFDPIGMTCPVSLQPKLILQSLWQDKIDWDIEIQDHRRNEFHRWLRDLASLKQLQIPRKIDKGNVALYAFGDASGSAYAAVIFARIEYNGVISVALLSAKSRLAPKKTTIPRLELMAATIAVRLARSVAQSLTRSVVGIHYWTDSSTVLAWIRRDVQWGAFEWNRVREIRSFSSQDDWKHVPGELNPADLPSRGCSPSQLIQSEWWVGPEWLREPESEWPISKQIANEDEIRNECKTTAVVHMINTDRKEFRASEYFSSYSRLIRFSAWILRFLKNRRIGVEKRKVLRDNEREKHPVNVSYATKRERKNLQLTFEEIKAAEIKLLKYLQTEMFSTLNKNKLSSFETFLNQDGLHVLKTKIFNRKDNATFLCPILLNNNSEIVHMLVRETHERLGHVGALIIMSNLRERYWIISLRKIIRSIISRCILCRRHRVKRMECETPPLPLNRVRDAAPFETVGIDFAGPLFLRGGGKAWICIFTCAVYRAVHFELTTALAVEGFLESLRRFIARRGRPRIIYCDNGTNFSGAKNALTRLDWKKVIRHGSVSQIKWFFNPPSAPWWGGWWERLIGVLKTILRKVLGRASLAYESLTTVLCDAEAIINARPLTYVSENPDDLIPLAPATFLHEIREVGVPDCDMLYHSKLNKKLRYRQKILDDLRKRFRTEYLGSLILRSNKKETREVNIGDVVLIGDDLHKRIDWPLARVMDEIPGRDGKSRVFILKTKNGTLKRPIQRIYPLEISQKTIDLATELREKTKIGNTDVKQTKHCKVTNAEPIVTTRSRRTSKKPQRLNYVPK